MLQVEPVILNLQLQNVQVGFTLLPVEVQVQVSDTTMQHKEQMLINKRILRLPDYKSY